MGRHGEHDVILEPDHQDQPLEEGVEVPLERIDPETLRNMVAAFVSREWSELADGGHSLDDKIEQVLRQLRTKQAKVVFDLTSETWNIVLV
jgi:hypothetical protein